MPLLDQNKAIKGYYESVKDKYPDITPDQFSDICKSLGTYIKHSIKNNKLPVIMIKSLGKFRVFKGAIHKQIKMENRLLREGIITEDFHKQNKEYFTKYVAALNKLEEDDE